MSPISSDPFRRVATALALSAGLFACSPVGTVDGAEPSADIAIQTIALGSIRVDDKLGGILAADVNGNGVRDFVLTGPGYIAAYSIAGTRLWMVAADILLSGKAEDEGLPGLHAPGIAVADSGDGKIELLFLTTDGKLAVLDGATGRRKHLLNLDLPQGAKRWEHLAVANFRGAGERDILLQATSTGWYRTGQFLAAYSLDGLMDGDAKPLWRRNDFIGMAHSGARIADLDGDGRHEVIGGMILRPDGSVAASLPVPFRHDNHLDAVLVADVRPDIPGLEVVALEEKHENRVFVYGLGGIVWSAHHRNQEPQNAAVGEFDPARPGLEIWLRSRHDTHQTPFVFDAHGRLISSYRMQQVAPPGWTVRGVEMISAIHWTGDGRQFAAAKERHASGHVGIFDPIGGRFVHRIREAAKRLYVADVTGDWREEIVVLTDNQLHIYSNRAKNPQPARPSLWADDHYRRGKITWNYYNP